MIRIEGGTFSTLNVDRQKASRPVTLGAFFLDETEVTVDAYRQCVDGGGCTIDQLTWLAECAWGRQDRGNFPLNCVSPVQAETFCRWADRRLPTEDEWEWAARGPEGRLYPWGNAPPAAQLCWNGPGNDAGQGYRKEGCAAGTSLADVTPAGLRDLGGSLSEWTSSPFCDYLDEDRAACSRRSCSFQTDRVCLERRVTRGGSWNTRSASGLRGAGRSSGILSRGGSDAGFRCARSP